jgi:hypothetical protein
MSRTREAPEIAAACARMMGALVRRARDGELEALEALAMLHELAGAQLGSAVLGYRASPAQASWHDVGRILGMTRQAAHQRFGGDAT